MFRKILASHPTMVLAVCAMAGAACGIGKGAGDDQGGADGPLASTAEAVIVTKGATVTSTPIGLAVSIENGVGQPLQVRAKQTFYINQIDMRVLLDASVDEGISGLATSGDFASLDWKGADLVDQSAEDSPNPDGTYTGRAFYRNAHWMEKDNTFTFVQVDSHGTPTAPGLKVDAGTDDTWLSSDAFFVRRLRAIQWTLDCISRTNCAGAKSFQEEALVEIRDSLHPEATFQIRPSTAALQVVWNQNPGKTYTIPVQQIAAPALDYGFTIDLFPVTAPNPDGTYSPGAEVTFQIQLRDGAGNPLHPAGVLPSFNSVISGADTSGIQYYQGFFQNFMTYYRRKHMEHQLASQIIGPAQKVGPIHSVSNLATDIEANGDLITADPARDGFFGRFYELPSFDTLLGGLSYPPLWDEPAPATFTYNIPANAEPGTYLVTQKGRRVYLGQDIPASTTIEIQVGTKKHTDVALTTGGCDTCHSNDSSLGVVNHANSDRSSCSGCHPPLSIELEGPIYVRTHFLHSRSDRFPADVGRCSNCHLGVAGIQRTSKSACLSCHSTYSSWHVQQYGAIDNMYVGGEADGFQQCSTTCHTDHPNSGLSGNGNCNGNGN